MKKLLLEIARCKEVDNVYKGEFSCCSDIVNSQEVEQKDFQLPEPWRGYIDKAKILFVGINPGIRENKYSEYPRKRWSDKKIEKYFVNYSTEEMKRRVDSNYWNGCEKLAKELMPGREPRPGIDYALTEGVHCKSTKENESVTKAHEKCSKKYLGRIIEVSAAKVIVCLGKKPREAFVKLFELNEDERVPRSICYPFGNRKVVFLTHPSPQNKGKKNLIYPRTFKDAKEKGNISQEEFKMLITAINREVSV